MKKLFLQELINFYDIVDENSEKQASAINAVLGEDLGIALLIHYLRFRKNDRRVEALDLPVTTGRQKGPRLDKWIICESGSEGEILYQVEVKNWSGHSIGGKPLPPELNQETLLEYRKDRWLRLFDNENKTLKHTTARKVLKKMRPPTKHSHLVQKPLICFWEPIHPRGDDEPFFSENVRSDDFELLYVFSMSNYVRQLLNEGKVHIDFEMAEVDKRINTINSMYG